jgi:ATP-dependent DNA ligase
LQQSRSDPAWLFEPKWDGWRTLCFVRDGKVHLVSRRKSNGKGLFERLEALNVEGMVMKRKDSVYAFSRCLVEGQDGCWKDDDTEAHRDLG